MTRKERDVAGMKLIARVNSFVLLKYFGEDPAAWPKNMADPRVAPMLEENKRWEARA